ncbi:hypothetical protein ACFL3V_01825 [Nanoarchaeota archaeon]
MHKYELELNAELYTEEAVKAAADILKETCRTDIIKGQGQFRIVMNSEEDIEELDKEFANICLMQMF